MDEEALAGKMAACTARVARAHESVFTEGERLVRAISGDAGYYYFADSDEGRMSSSRRDRRRGGLEILLQRQ